MHVWHTLTGHAVTKYCANTEKRTISLQNIIIKKKERLKQAPRTDLSVSGWRMTGKSSCMEVVMWFVSFVVSASVATSQRTQ